MCRRVEGLYSGVEGCVVGLRVVCVGRGGRVVWRGERREGRVGLCLGGGRVRVVKGRVQGCVCGERVGRRRG